jgi:hypothetical protein
MDYLLIELIKLIVGAFKGKQTPEIPKPKKARKAASPPAPPSRVRQMPTAKAAKPKVVASGQLPKAMPPLPPIARPPETIKAPATAARTSTPSVSAAGVRQLFQSRRGTLRTVIVLNEILQPPLALRKNGWD